MKKWHNAKWGIPEPLGRVLKDGRVVISSKYSRVYMPRQNINLYDICRTVFGGPTKSVEIPVPANMQDAYLTFKRIGLEVTPDIDNTIVIPNEAAHLIITYVRNEGYANMGLQEFLMKTWRK